jgi:hypothetical protein
MTSIRCLGSKRPQGGHGATDKKKSSGPIRAVGDTSIDSKWRRVYLRRLDSGASESPYSTEKPGRLVLEISAVNRYLFEKELTCGNKASSHSSTGTGSRYWAQVALERIDRIGWHRRARPGLQLASERGYFSTVLAFISR